MGWSDLDKYHGSSVEDVSISKVPVDDIPEAGSLVDVHISHLRLKPPDPNVYEVVYAARPDNA